MADAGSIYFNALSGLGDDIASQMQQYHREHQQYDEAYKMADALSRIGIDKRTGQPVQIQYDEKGKPIKDENVMTFGDPKAIEQYRNFNRRQAAGNAGALNAISRLVASGLSRAQSAAIEKSMEEKFPTQVVPGTEPLPLTAGQRANVLMTQEAAKAPPAGKIYWEGDAVSPPGYYTPGKIADIRSKQKSQQARSTYQDLRTQMSLSRDKMGALTKELSEFTASYGFPPALFESKTKVYEEGSSVGGREIPKGYYGVETVNPKTGDVNVLNVGKEEFKQGKTIYEKLKKHRETIDELGGKVQTETSRAKAMFDWANRNPTAPGAAQVKAKAEALLNELSSLGGAAQPVTPAPVQEEE